LQSTEPVVEEEVLDASTYTTLSFEYVDKNEKTLSVSKNSTNYPTGDLVIPAKVIFNGEICEVVSIPDSYPGGSVAFTNCSGLTGIVIPDSVTYIGEYAFGYCNGLKSVNIPDSVETLSDGAFYFCEGLLSLIIGDSVQTIGEYAFSTCHQMSNLVMGRQVTNIESNAFECCDSLTTINYIGTETEWSAITIATGNEALTNATKVYNYQV